MIRFQNKLNYGNWVPYVGIRHKDFYDIMLYDGIIFKSMYPNGRSWSLMDGYTQNERKIFLEHKLVDKGGYVQDKDVIAIRLLTDEEIISREITHFTGKEREVRLHQHNPNGLSFCTLLENELISEHTLRELINDVRDIAIEKHQSQSLREVISRRIKSVVKPFIK